MAFFMYQAFSREGKRVSGKIEAKTIQLAKTKLIHEGLYPVFIVIEDTKKKENFLSFLFSSPISLKDKIFFTRQLILLLKSGVSLTESLNLIIYQTPAYMKSTIEAIRDDVREGESFAKALSYFPKSFPRLYIKLVEAGEASGQMEKVLHRLVIFLEDEDAFNKVVSQALQGPIIQLTMVFVVALALLTIIVPKLIDVFKSMGQEELPLLTTIVINISNFIVKRYIVLFLILGAIIALYSLWAQSSFGRYCIDTIKLRIPVIRYFTRVASVIQFSQTLGLLLESGVNISEALGIVVQIVDNQVLVSMLEKAKENILKEGKVAGYLKKTNLFSLVDLHLIEVGEQSGSLDVMLVQIGKYNQDDLQQYSFQLTSILNPLATLLLAIVVGTILIAVMGPIITMSNGL